jgi:signal transduction histidine kinase
VANAGGTASVVSSLGRGTVVRLVWPAVEEPS